MRRGVLRPYDSRSFRDDVGRSRARSLRPSGIERRSDSSRFRLFCFDRYRFSMDWANRRFRRFRRLSFGLRRPIGLFDYCSELCGNFAKVRKYSHLPTEFNNAPIITRRPWPLPDGAAVHIYFGCKNIKLQSQPGALKGRPNNIFSVSGRFFYLNSELRPPSHHHHGTCFIYPTWSGVPGFWAPSVSKGLLLVRMRRSEPPPTRRLGLHIYG